MSRQLSSSQSAPSLRAKTAPAATRHASSTPLPSIWSATGNTSSHSLGGAGANIDFSLFQTTASDSMLLELKNHGTMRGNSPPRPGSSGRMLCSSGPYLLGGLSNAADLRNTRTVRLERRIDGMKQETRESTITQEGPGGSGATGHEHEFTRAADNVDKSLSDLRRRLESFEGGSPVAERSSMTTGRMRRPGGDGGDDDDDMIDNIREKFELYKMCRKIEPELPPLTPLPGGLYMQRPDCPLVDYNWSEEAVSRHVLDSRVERYRQKRLHQENLQRSATWKREHMLDCSREVWSKALAQKRRQAEDALQAQRCGSSKAVPKDVLAEKWIVVYSIAAYMKKVKEAVAYNHMSAEEKSACEKSQKVHDVVMNQELLEEIMNDDGAITRLIMLTQMYRRRVRVKDKVAQTFLLFRALKQWNRKADVFISFKRFMATVRYIQGWWRRTSQRLKTIREKISKRWERLERLEVIRIHHGMTHVSPGDMLDIGLRHSFIDHELRARRYFILSILSIWKEDSLHWRMQEKAKRAMGVIEPENIDLAPCRPSYLPPNHPWKEYSEQMPCPEGCLGRQGDEEILKMIRDARKDPTSFRKIPQNAKAKPKGGNKKRRNSKEAGQSSDASAPTRLFGEVTSDDLKIWGVDPSAMPSVGQKPSPDEGEGRYP